MATVSRIKVFKEIGMAAKSPYGARPSRKTAALPVKPGAAES
jgi:hypothetical protein